MASKRKRGNAWYLDWRDPETGQRFKSSLGPITEEQAEAALQLKKAELLTGLDIFGHKSQISKVPLFDDFAKDYIIWYSSQYPSSAKRTAQIIETYAPYVRTKRLDQITPTDAKDIILQRLKAPLKPAGRRALSPDRVTRKARTVSSATVTKEFKTFKAMFQRAVEWKIIQEHPFAHVNPPQERRSKVPGFYSPAQLASLYQHSKPERKGEIDYRPVWQLMANTGLRRTEALKAKRVDVRNGRSISPDLPDREVLFVESDPEGGGRTKSTKLRKIPLNKQAISALDVLGKDRLLPAMSKESLTRAFRRCARAAGLPGSIHWLRHTFGTNLALNGVAVHVIKELMGHSSITTTEQYLQLVEGHLSSAVDRISL